MRAIPGVTWGKGWVSSPSLTHSHFARALALGRACARALGCAYTLFSCNHAGLPSPSRPLVDAQSPDGSSETAAGGGGGTSSAAGVLPLVLPLSDISAVRRCSDPTLPTGAGIWVGLHSNPMVRTSVG